MLEIKKNKGYLICTMQFLFMSLLVLGCSNSNPTTAPPEGQEQESEEDPVSRLDDNEADFYTANIPATEKIVSLTGANSRADSNTLNNEIETLSNQGGGVLRITGGTYYIIDVQLRSNIHLKIDADVTLEPYIGGATGNLTMIDVGNGFYVENVAVTCTDEDSEDRSKWYKVNIPEGTYRGVRYIDVSNAYNFKVAGICLTDTYSTFSNIVLNLPDNRNPNEIARKGVVKNVVMEDMHVGYGVVQMQAGKRVLYRNIDGKGGVTLRIETGAAATNVVNVKTVDSVVVRDIKIRFGDAAMNFSPHRVDQGRVDVDRVTAINSTHAVQVSSGFYDNSGTLDNLGTFDSSSYIDNIVVTGGDGAQVKGKDFKYFECAEREEMLLKCMNPDESSHEGRSVGAIRDGATEASGCDDSKNGCYEIGIGKITKTNDYFVVSDDFVHPDDSRGSCDNLPEKCIN